MSVEQKDKIDYIGKNEDGRQLRLAISDHLDWSDEKEHLHTLQEKVNTYISFIESGQIADHYDNQKPDSVSIKIFFLHEPSKLAKEFLEHTQGVLSNISVNLESEVVDQNTLNAIGQ